MAHEVCVSAAYYDDDDDPEMFMELGGGVVGVFGLVLCVWICYVRRQARASRELAVLSNTPTASVGSPTLYAQPAYTPPRVP